MINLPALLHDAPGPDLDAREAVAHRARNVLRPPGALARLDEIAVWLAGWQRTPTPAVENPAVILFAADHGVVAEGVSAFPGDVTTAMLRALHDGVATVSAMAPALAIPLHVVDAGVGRPTANLRHKDALTPDRFETAFQLGRDAVASHKSDLLVLGELGIGNTTAAAVVGACLHRGDASDWTGPGTGVAGEQLRNKIAVVDAAQSRVPSDTPPLEILRKVGGSELVAIAGAIVEARLRSIPVLLDGYVVTAAAAPLQAAFPTALDHCLAGHCSPEPGHHRLLDILQIKPLLDLEMRLGEGTGALAAVPLIRLAAASAVPWFPVVGLLIALLGAGFFAALSYILPPLPATALTIAILTLLTGAFHEDGLADIADAFGGGWTRAQRLAILDDPRRGAFGTLALVLSILIRVSLLAALTPWQALAVLTAAHTLSRAAAIAAARGFPRAKSDGLGASILDATSRLSTALSLAIALLFTIALTGPWAALFLAAVALAAVALAVAAVGWLAARKIGGVTGDVIGGMQQIAELAALATGVALLHTFAIDLPWWTP